MRTIKEIIESGGELTLGERFELWESKEDKNVLEDFPLGDLSDEQYHEVLDKLDITRRIVVNDLEVVMIGGLYIGNDFPYIVMEKNVYGEYKLFQVDNVNDIGKEQYRVIKRYSIFDI